MTRSQITGDAKALECVFSLVVQCAARALRHFGLVCEAQVCGNSIDQVKKLQIQTIEATKDLRETHRKLLLEIEKKKNLKQTIRELQELYQDINDLKQTIQKI